MTESQVPGRVMAGDAAWNFVALGITAATGAAMTFVIAGWMGTAALGVFAQLYAIHVIAAQVAVLGAHDSVQKHAAERAGDSRGDDDVVVAALGIVLVSAGLLAGLVALLARSYGAFVSSPDVARGLYLVAPGIVCFALNKVLFAALNARARLRLYAGMQILRAVFVLIAVSLVVMLGLPDYAVGGIFAAAEVALLPCLLGAVRPALARARPTIAHWSARHLSFGGRGVVNGILLETHLRVDVMTLSYFATDRAIGVYAFAALFAEAVYQVPVVIRTVGYPRLVQLAASGNRAGLARTVRRLSLASGVLCAVAAGAVAVGYPVVAAWFDAEFVASGWPVLRVLLIGMVAYGFFVPFDQLLLQSGLPGRQSLLMAGYVGINVILNLVLIPRFGLLGAAVATAVALSAAGIMLTAASWLWLGYRRGVLFYRAS